MFASPPRVEWLKCHLHKKFGIVNDGTTSYFLEIKVDRDMERIILELRQQKHIKKILLTFDEELPNSKKNGEESLYPDNASDVVSEHVSC